MTSALVWFRRDLRTYDHAALFHALKAHDQVYCVFVFDSTMLAKLPRSDRRVEFILRAVVEVAEALRRMGGALIILQGDPCDEIPKLAARLGVQAVYANRDYEPAALQRDAAVEGNIRRLAEVEFFLFKDQVIFDCDEVLTQQRTPFSVFTPYKNAWLKRLSPFYLQAYPVERYAAHLAIPDAVLPAPTLSELGFLPADLASLPLPTGMRGARRLFLAFTERLDHYASDRDFPAVNGTSTLSAHLRFGTVSIRQLTGYAQSQSGRGAATWLSELIWRDFYHMILWHHPHVVTQAFKPAMETLVWDDAPDLLAAWQQGKTGYPLVDAAMRQLMHTGFMHNRLRMVTASFLTKDLGVDWRLGERWFAEKLLDFDLAANNGGWQWAASTGCDAQPWFRIFNPVTQSEKFDPQGHFIRRYVPEILSLPNQFIHAPWKMNASQQAACGVLLGRDYPLPVVDHAVARERTLQRFSTVRK
ncbi:deoxyribodipyrimidine photolyase [Rugosibacter aromaticivorans]|uniref:Deoxyribodipyrimidine photo-lyase n=1 Tax=Rugosibacter aromaticivorans TaxID=1565605 RepID=A0A0C5JPB4_9PROT|nr:deoxyribodipyrimidine photo-lyase [Rugosibacter aromaticivorans]AJP49131.1 deoxyribodipyrimidine photolyase [Rugosibacter aromaticivorans]TBR12764.1 MAG: deoxyribodipyrimidine photo-lyase [Rugosibacter sp.]